MLDFPMNMSVGLALAALLLLGVALAARKFAPSMARIPMWLGSAALGAAVGVGVTMASVALLGYVKYSDLHEAPSNALGGGIGMPGGGGGMPAGGMGGGGMGGGGMGGGGMGGGGMGGGGMGGGMGTSDGVVSARRLTTLIAKLDLLSRGLSVDLSADQQRELAQLLTSIDDKPEVPADQIDATVQAIQRLLSTEQMAALDSIDLPRPLPFGGRRPGGPSGPAPGLGQPSPPPSVEAPDIKNPFLVEANAASLNRLREFLAQSGSLDESGDAVQEVSAEVTADLPFREDLSQPSPPSNSDAIGTTN